MDRDILESILAQARAGQRSADAYALQLDEAVRWAADKFPDYTGMARELVATRDKVLARGLESLLLERKR